MQSKHYSCQILIKLEFSQQVLEKSSNIEIHENPTSRSRVLLCGRRDRLTDRQVNITKLTDAFRNFTNMPKMTPLGVLRSRLTWREADG